MTRKVNQNTLLALKEAEGVKLHAYQDGGGVWTIGFGHTRGVKPGDTCTQAQADEWLSEDVASAADTVEKAVHVPLNDNQFGALVMFVFNIGARRFLSSTLLKKLNGGDYEHVPTYLRAWVFVNGKRSAGLQNRREREVALWLS